MDHLSGPVPREPRRVERDSARATVAILFQRHYATLLRTAVALVGDREGAEDAVQDAFVSLYHHWGGLRDVEAAETYVRSAVLNRCRSRIRTRVRERRRGGDLVGVPATAASSDEVLGRRQDAERVGVALRRLPRRQREVVTCRYLLELSVSETAQVLGISDGAVKQHTHRALRALHTALEVTP